MKNSTTHMVNKQSILKRMLRFAANYLDVKRVELLDPLVVLFLEALAEEVYTVSTEIHNIESRMLDKLASLIAPDISLSAMPAHCILHAIPQDAEAILSMHSTFVLRDKKQPHSDIKELTFYPLCNTKIRNGRISYMVFNGLFFQIEQDQSKTLISRSRTIQTSAKNNLWIGMEVDESIEILNDISFYIDFPGTSNRDALLNTLPYSIWNLNNAQLKLKQGIHTIKNEIDEVVGLFDDLSISSNLHKSILDSYTKHFLTIADDTPIAPLRQGYPDTLKDTFASHIFDDLSTPLVWVEIELPSIFTPATMEMMQISINAFPIVNKTLHSKTIEINETLPIIPLRTENHESLLAIHSVSDSENNSYEELPFNDTPAKHYRTYSLRRGGYERYSKREMREYLLDLIRKMESHAAIQNERKGQKGEEQDDSMIQVRALIKHIKELVATNKDRLEMLNYISIDNLKKSDVFFVKYWTTNSVRANNIKQYTTLEYADIDVLIKSSDIFTLSSTEGGKYAPQITERRNLQLKSFTDRSMLVTNEDIIDYCRKNFSSTIDHVEITKGLMQNPDKKHEFLCTKDIVLTPRKDIDLLLSEYDAEIFRKSLQMNSPATFNYRVIIK